MSVQNVLIASHREDIGQLWSFGEMVFCIAVISEEHIRYVIRLDCKFAQYEEKRDCVPFWCDFIEHMEVFSKLKKQDFCHEYNVH